MLYVGTWIDIQTDGKVDQQTTERYADKEIDGLFDG